MERLNELSRMLSLKPCKLVFVRQELCVGNSPLCTTPVCHDGMCGHPDGACHSGHTTFRPAKPGEHEPHLQASYFRDEDLIGLRCICGESVRFERSPMK